MPESQLPSFPPDSFAFYGCLRRRRFSDYPQRDIDSLRKYCIAWRLARLVLGYLRAITVKDVPAELGGAVAIILISTFMACSLRLRSPRTYLGSHDFALARLGCPFLSFELGFCFFNSERLMPPC